jgi:hypothetical protein
MENMRKTKKQKKEVQATSDGGEQVKGGDDIGAEAKVDGQGSDDIGAAVKVKGSDDIGAAVKVKGSDDIGAAVEVQGSDDIGAEAKVKGQGSGNGPVDTAGEANTAGQGSDDTGAELKGEGQGKDGVAGSQHPKGQVSEADEQLRCFEGRDKDDKRIIVRLRKDRTDLFSIFKSGKQVGQVVISACPTREFAKDSSWKSVAENFVFVDKRIFS